jgi:hypothetical protein
MDELMEGIDVPPLVDLFLKPGRFSFGDRWQRY